MELWRAHLHDLDGNALAPLIGFSNMTIGDGLSTNSALSLVCPRHDLVIEVVRAHENEGGLLISAERINEDTGDWVYGFTGEVVEHQEVVGSDGLGTISFVGAGPFRQLQEARIADTDNRQGRTPDGLSMEGDRAGLAVALINKSNEIDGPTWVRADPADQGESGHIGIQNWGGHRTVGECIADLASTSVAGGFEWHIEPTIETDGQGLVLGRFKSAREFGTDRSSSVFFDHMTSLNNCQEATRRVSWRNYANKFIHLAADADPYEVSESAGGEIGKRGVWESRVDADMIDASLRRSLLNLHKGVRSRPQTLYEFTANRSDTGNTPRPLIDCGVGDRVHVASGPLGVDGVARIWDWQITVENQTETVEYGLYPN